MVDSVGDVFIELSTGQVLALCRMLGLAPPPALLDYSPADVVDVVDDEEADEGTVYLRMVEELRELGLITSTPPPQGEPTVVPAVAELLGAFAEPGLIMLAALERDGWIETRFYAVIPEMGAEHRELEGNRHAFVPFDGPTVLARVLDFVGLEHYDVGYVQGGTADRGAGDQTDESVGFDIDCRALEVAVACLDSTGDGRPDDSEGPEGEGRSLAIATLAAAGVDPETARNFVDAVMDKRSSATVTVLHRPVEEMVEGGSLTWMSGHGGHWINEPDEHDSSRCRIHSASAQQIAHTLLGYLPAPFATA